MNQFQKILEMHKEWKPTYFIESNENYQKLDALSSFTQIISKGNHTHIKGNNDCLLIENHGDHLKAICTGDVIKLINNGRFSLISLASKYVDLINNGIHSIINVTGDYSRIKNNAYNVTISSNGDYSLIINYGCGCKVFSSGKNSQIELYGGDSIGVALSESTKIKGAVGDKFFLYEKNLRGPGFNHDRGKYAVVDDKIIKANIFYTLVDGEFIEVNS